MDNYLPTLKLIREDLSFQVSQAVTQSLKTSDIGLRYIRITFLDELKDNQTVISLSYRFSTYKTVLKNDIDSVMYAIENTINIPELRTIQYEVEDKYYICIFKDLAVRIEQDVVTLISLTNSLEKEIPRKSVAHALIIITALFNPAIQEYYNLRGQHFLDRGYSP